MAMSRQDLSALQKRLAEIGTPTMSKIEVFDRLLRLHAGKESSGIPFSATSKIDDVMGIANRWIENDEMIAREAQKYADQMPRDLLDTLVNRIEQTREFVLELERMRIARLMERSQPQIGYGT